jgi:hypothetical protein
MKIGRSPFAGARVRADASLAGPASGRFPS